jgi:hypothetical protein
LLELEGVSLDLPDGHTLGRKMLDEEPSAAPVSGGKVQERTDAGPSSEAPHGHLLDEADH